MTYQKINAANGFSALFSKLFFGPPFEYLRRLREQIVKFFKKKFTNGLQNHQSWANVGLAFPPPSSPTQIPPIEGGDIFFAHFQSTLIFKD